MLAFILEEDVGYRLSIKTRKARARIWGYWSVRKAERCRPCSGGSVGYVSMVTCAGPGSAMLHCDVVHIWYAKTEWLIFFFLFFSSIEVLGFRLCEAKCHPKRMWFSKSGKGTLNFKEISCCGAVEWRLRGRDISAGAECRRGGRTMISMTNSLCHRHWVITDLMHIFLVSFRKPIYILTHITS